MRPCLLMAAKMLNQETLDPKLANRLIRIDDLCARRGGQLLSRQVVAAVIADWENR